MPNRKWVLFGKRVDPVEAWVVGMSQAITWLILSSSMTLFLTDEVAKAIAFAAIAAFGFLTILAIVCGSQWTRKAARNPSRCSPYSLQANAAPLPDPPKARQEEVLPSSTEELEKQLLNERAAAKRWEYACLNYYLVLGTQFMLDWMYVQRHDEVLSLTWLRTNFRRLAESELRAVLNALITHGLIRISGDKIVVTGKGCEYVEWRGLDYCARSMKAWRKQRAAAKPLKNAALN